MTKALEKTALWLAMAAISVNGHVFAQGVEAPAVVEAIQETAAPAQPIFSVEQIEQMVGPIALYPDALLAQVLMAATYPMEVAQANQWLKKNDGLEGAALDDAVAAQPWDPSVKTLVFFPSVLERMAQDLAWTQDLGDAFLAQEADVMGAIQRLRHQAQGAGNLASNSEQIVRTQGQTIVVEAADPTVVYVPTYNPATVYGPAWVPATTYYPTTYSYSSAYPTWVTFGAGVAVGALLVAAIDWARDDHYYYGYPRYRRPHHPHIYYAHNNYWGRDWDGPRYGHAAWRSYRPAYLERRDVYVDKSKTVNVENNYFGRQWEHDPAHRRNVSYRDPNVARRFVDADSGRRADRDGAKWFGRDANQPPDRGGAQPLDRDALRRLDRSKPAMLPADQATRDALQGTERERRARIMGGEHGPRPFGDGAASSGDAAQWRRKGGEPERRRIEGGAAGLPEPATRQFERPSIGKQARPTGEVPQIDRPEGAGVQATPRARDLGRETRAWGKTEAGASPQSTQGMGSRRSFESGAQRGEPAQMPSYGRVEPQTQKRSEPWQGQQRQDARQFQQRVEPQTQKRSEPWQGQQRPDTRQFQQRVEPQTQKRSEPWQGQQRPDTRQFQQRVEPKQMQPPTVQRSQEGAARQFSQQQRNAPKGVEPQRQQPGGQGSQQNTRRRNDDDKNPLSR